MNRRFIHFDFVPTSRRADKSYYPDSFHHNDDVSGHPPAVIDIEDVLKETLNLSWEKMERLNQGSPSVSQLYLFDACLNADDHEDDCVTVCQDKGELFSSWQTLWQCLMLSSLSLTEKMFPGLNNDVKEEIDEVLEFLNISDNTFFDALTVLNATMVCAAASCRDSARGNCSVQISDHDDITHWNDTFNALSHICDNTQIEINPDIAGPGVLISYMIQCILALSVLLLVRLIIFRTTINEVAYPVLRMLQRQGSFTERNPRFSSALARIEKSNLAHSTAHLVAEFQEAQCYFVMGIQIALLVSSSRLDTADVAGNLASLRATNNAMQTVGQAGFNCILITQMNLRHIQLDSFYSYGLSIISVVLTAVASVEALQDSFDEAYGLFQEASSLEECGKNAPIRLLCDPTFGNRIKAAEDVLPAVLICLIVAAIPSCLKLTNKLTQLKIIHDMWSRLSKSRRNILDWVTYLIIKAAQGAFIAAEITMVCGIGGAIQDLADALGPDTPWIFSLFGTTRTTFGQWSIGQVIAVLVWVPVIAKFISMVLLGFERGLRMRISSAFIIKRRSAVSSVADGINPDDSDSLQRPLGDMGANNSANPPPAWYTTVVDDGLRRRETF